MIITLFKYVALSKKNEKKFKNRIQLIMYINESILISD